MESDLKKNEMGARAPQLGDLEAFAYRLLDIDDLGLYCSDDVREEARRLLGMPPHPDAILLKAGG